MINTKANKKGIKIYKELYTDKPNSFEIWWYGNKIWKYVYIILAIIWVLMIFNIGFKRGKSQAYLDCYNMIKELNQALLSI